MKIMYVDIIMTGHHFEYADALVKNANAECVIISSEKENKFGDTVRYFQLDNPGKSFVKYVKWITEIIRVAKLEKPDIIHFLYGDMLYRFFGTALRRLKGYKTVVTFHHVRKSKAHDISMSNILKNITCGVVHTDTIFNDIKTRIGAQNICKIEYPHFSEDISISREKAREYFGLNCNVPVLVSIGGTRYDKGLDILLEALKNVTDDFQLLIAGKPEYFSEDFINERIEGYKEKVVKKLSFLSTEEISYAWEASDIIVLPYRKCFDGASGPLGEGVWRKKYIIGPDNGSLGDLIKHWHLGSTFKCEDTQSLAAVISEKLKHGCSLDSKSSEYREKLKLSSFIEGYNEVYKKL